MVKNVIKYSNPILRKQSNEVILFDSNFEQRLEDLINTFKFYDPLGISAVQIGYLDKLFITKIGNKMEVFINCEIIHKSEETIKEMSGCLSFPTIFLPTVFSREILVNYKNIKMEDVERTYSGTESLTIQHEYDHTLGRLFIDGMSVLQKSLVEDKVKKLKQSELWDNDEKLISAVQERLIKFSESSQQPS